MADFFTADPHLDHGNIIKYCRRHKFMSPEELELVKMVDNGTIPADEIKISPASVQRMNDYIIDQYNLVVGRDDVLWCVGDIFWGRDKKRCRELRDRIQCQNLILIWGNHDPAFVGSLFRASHQQILINVEDQGIFLNHYPMRSWDKAHHGAWMLYGHVHGIFYQEDEKGMNSGEYNTLLDNFRRILVEKGYDENGEIDQLAKLLMEPVMANRGINLTVDVGVDTHDYRPWSMDELRAFMAPKMPRWKARREGNLRSIQVSARKSSNP